MSDRRLIEDNLPIAANNTVAQQEKIGHAALHPRKLHPWWARHPSGRRMRRPHARRRPGATNDATPSGSPSAPHLALSAGQPSW
ncbi:MAG: DUF1156 domain-containing protein [Actinomycetota bacterium]|jgi:hypothetical protein|nr:DUF1156 domain-containing protein [Actinomycetota bacterium]